MITLLKNKELNKYRTIWNKDIPEYRRIVHGEYSSFRRYKRKIKDNVFANDIRFSIVPKAEVKNILNNEFSSKGRGGDYHDGLPSPTIIGDTLFPLDLERELYKIKWLNDVNIEDFEQSEERGRESMRLGTYIHKILELWLIDERDYYKKDIESLIKIARNDAELKEKLFVHNINIFEYETIAREVLPDFIKNELYRYDCIGSEVFFRNKLFQGTIDMIALNNNNFYIIDFKTTRRTNPNGSRKFSSPSDIGSYKRQLCCYYMALLKNGIIPDYKKNDISFNIVQFHLISNEYKTIKVSLNDIVAYMDDINNVIKWYWENK